MALGTAFTYQGQLIKDGAPANGACDLRFTLFNAGIGGSPVGPPVEKLAWPVTGGLFTVPDLDFGSAAFAGEARWLQVEVRCPPDGTYTVVGDRQALTATPYALYAAGNWSLWGNAGTTAGPNFLGTTDNQALELKVFGQRALRIEPSTTSPNLIGGSISNTVGAGVYGATIAGGGEAVAACGSVAQRALLEPGLLELRDGRRGWRQSSQLPGHRRRGLDQQCQRRVRHCRRRLPQHRQRVVGRGWRGLDQHRQRQMSHRRRGQSNAASGEDATVPWGRAATPRTAVLQLRRQAGRPRPTTRAASSGPTRPLLTLLHSQQPVCGAGQRRGEACGWRRRMAHRAGCHQP